MYVLILFLTRPTEAQVTMYKILQKVFKYKQYKSLARLYSILCVNKTVDR